MIDRIIQRAVELSRVRIRRSFLTQVWFKAEASAALTLNGTIVNKGARGIVNPK